jgi:hypothetical protein
MTLLFAAGCASVHIYDYAPKPLPAGSEPLAVVEWSLHDLRNVSWSYGEPDPDASRRAELSATASGLSATAKIMVSGSPLDLSYLEIVDGVRMVTQLNGTWTVYIYDRQNRLVQMEFSSYSAVRLFLDASYALAHQS